MARMKYKTHNKHFKIVDFLIIYRKKKIATYNGPGTVGAPRAPVAKRAANKIVTPIPMSMLVLIGNENLCVPIVAIYNQLYIILKGCFKNLILTNI